MDMKEKYKKAEEHLKNREYGAHDFNGFTCIVHQDESSFIFHFSIMEEDNEFIYVFSEHNGYHFFHKEDLQLFNYTEYK